MLFHGAWADVQLTSNLFVAATLHQQVQHLLVAGSHFDLFQVDHEFPPVCLRLTLAFVIAYCTTFANSSRLSAATAKYFRALALRGSDRGFHEAFRKLMIG